MKPDSTRPGSTLANGEADGPVPAAPLLTLETHEILRAALRAGVAAVVVSLALGRSQASVGVAAPGWDWQGQRFPWLEGCRGRTVYRWTGGAFEPVARFSGSLVKLVPTPWGPPTFEIDGIKMLPTAQVSPWEDAQAKVALIQPRGKAILDTCGGLGYFAAACLAGGAAPVLSFERNPDVLWLRRVNPWSPPPGGALELREGDIAREIAALPDASFEAILHDPPRFGIAGELYAQDFHDQLARGLRPGGRLFHYAGPRNRLTSGRDVPAEVARRLRRSGFSTARRLDGILAVRGSARGRAGRGDVG